MTIVVVENCGKNSGKHDTFSQCYKKTLEIKENFCTYSTKVFHSLIIIKMKKL